MSREGRHERFFREDISLLSHIRQRVLESCTEGALSSPLHETSRYPSLAKIRMIRIRRITRPFYPPIHMILQLLAYEVSTNRHFATIFQHLVLPSSIELLESCLKLLDD